MGSAERSQQGRQAVAVGRNVSVVGMEDLNDISEATKE